MECILCTYAGVVYVETTILLCGNHYLWWAETHCIKKKETVEQNMKNEQKFRRTDNERQRTD